MGAAQSELKFRRATEFPTLHTKQQHYVVSPGAVHSPFEHILGVYQLDDEIVHPPKKDHGGNGMDECDVLFVKLNGLLHEVNHMFESGSLPKVLQGSFNWSHEDMSVSLVDYIADDHHIDSDEIMEKTVKVIASIARASEHNLKEQSFLYDIVANGRNGIDVDKFDYMVRDSRAFGVNCRFQFDRLLQTMRVLEEETCYRAKEYFSVHKLVLTSADLNQIVDMDTKVKGILLMVLDAYLKAYNQDLISSAVNDPACENLETDTSTYLKEVRGLLSRVMSKFCNVIGIESDKLLNVTSQLEHIEVRCFQSDLTKAMAYAGSWFGCHAQPNPLNDLVAGSSDPRRTTTTFVEGVVASNIKRTPLSWFRDGFSWFRTHEPSDIDSQRDSLHNSETIIDIPDGSGPGPGGPGGDDPPPGGGGSGGGPPGGGGPGGDPPPGGGGPGGNDVFHDCHAPFVETGQDSYTTTTIFLNNIFFLLSLSSLSHTRAWVPDNLRS